MSAIARYWGGFSNWFGGLNIAQKFLVIIGCLFLLGLPGTILGGSEIEGNAVFIRPPDNTPVLAVEAQEPEVKDEMAPVVVATRSSPPPQITPAVQPQPELDESLEAEILEFIINTGAASITIQTSAACDEDTILLMADWISDASASIRRFTALLESGTSSQIATIRANYPVISTTMNELNSNVETHLSYCETLLGL